MKLLLDTHAFLWFVTGDARLSRRAQRAMQREDAELLVSVASVWEMAIKASLGRLVLPNPIREFMKEKFEAGFSLLPIEWHHAAAVASLPFHHRDPFDRLLVVQSAAEGLLLVTGDPAFRRYETKVLW